MRVGGRAGVLGAIAMPYLVGSVLGAILAMWLFGWLLAWVCQKLFGMGRRRSYMVGVVTAVILATVIMWLTSGKSLVGLTIIYGLGGVVALAIMLGPKRR